MFTGVTFSKPPTFGIKTFHGVFPTSHPYCLGHPYGGGPCSGAAMACTCGIGTWFILAISKLSWGLPGGYSLGCVSPMNRNIDGICTTRYAILKNYQAYPLNWHIWWCFRKENGMLQPNNSRYWNNLRGPFRWPRIYGLWYILWVVNSSILIPGAQLMLDLNKNFFFLCVGGGVLAMNIGHNRLCWPHPKQTRVNICNMCISQIDSQAGMQTDRQVDR